MNSSRAVIWLDGEGLPRVGELEVTCTGVLLKGRGKRRELVQLFLALDELTDVRVGRTQGEQVNGRPSLILERRRGAPLLLSPLSDLGLVRELEETLAWLLAPKAPADDPRA